MTEPRVELKARLATLWREAANAVDHGYERELRYEYATAQWLMEHGVTLADHRAPLPLGENDTLKKIGRLLQPPAISGHGAADYWFDHAQQLGEIAKAALSTPALPPAEGLPRVEVCRHCGNVPFFKCEKCGDEWYDTRQSMAHTNQRFAPSLRAAHRALEKIANTTPQPSADELQAWAVAALQEQQNMHAADVFDTALSRPVSDRGRRETLEELEAAVVAWVADVETIPGVIGYQLSRTGPTEHLFQMGRDIRARRALATPGET